MLTEVDPLRSAEQNWQKEYKYHLTALSHKYIIHSRFKIDRQSGANEILVCNLSSFIILVKYLKSSVFFFHLSSFNFSKTFKIFGILFSNFFYADILIDL